MESRGIPGIRMFERFEKKKKEKGKKKKKLRPKKETYKREIRTRFGLVTKNGDKQQGVSK